MNVTTDQYYKPFNIQHNEIFSSSFVWKTVNIVTNEYSKLERNMEHWKIPGRQNTTNVVSIPRKQNQHSCSEPAEIWDDGVYQ